MVEQERRFRADVPPARGRASVARFCGDPLLHTADAHGLYEQLGLGLPDAEVMGRLP
jgi:hypothetical protein